MDERTQTPQPFIIGLDASEGINRVEGLNMSPELRADFERLEAEGIPGDERRQYLVQKYISGR